MGRACRTRSWGDRSRERAGAGDGATRGRGGAHVLLADIADDRGQRLAEELAGRAAYVRCDVTSEPGVAALVQRAVDRHRRLDCMLDNAGVVGSGPIDQLALEDFALATAVLLRSSSSGSSTRPASWRSRVRSDGPVDHEHRRSRGWLGTAPLRRSQVRVIGLTRDVGAELTPWGVRAVAVAPGRILTPMNAARIVGDPDDLVATAEAFKTRTPLGGRIGLAEDVAYAALWLARDEAGFVSGTTFLVDGGLTTGSKETWSRRISGAGHSPESE